MDVSTRLVLDDWYVEKRRKKVESYSEWISELCVNIAWKPFAATALSLITALSL